MILTVLAGLVALAFVAHLVLLGLAARERAELRAALADAPETAPRTDLPTAIETFARRNLLGAEPGAGLTEFTQDCAMRLSKGAGWTPMDARQTAATSAAGFAWHARLRRGPLTVVAVTDAFAAGAGSLTVRALGSIPIARTEGPETDRGEAMRYLAELPWTPDAILLNPDLDWTDLGEGRFDVAVDTAGGRAAVTLLLDALGDITGMEAERRRTTDEAGNPVDLPWRGAFSDYGGIGGRRIPLSGEVGYLHPDGYEAYWRGTITSYRPPSE